MSKFNAGIIKSPNLLSKANQGRRVVGEDRVGVDSQKLAASSTRKHVTDKVHVSEGQSQTTIMSNDIMSKSSNDNSNLSVRSERLTLVESKIKDNKALRDILFCKNHGCIECDNLILCFPKTDSDVTSIVFDIDKQRACTLSLPVLISVEACSETSCDNIMWKIKQSVRNIAHWKLSNAMKHEMYEQSVSLNLFSENEDHFRSMIDTAIARPFLAFTMSDSILNELDITLTRFESIYYVRKILALTHKSSSTDDSNHAASFKDLISLQLIPFSDNIDPIEDRKQILKICQEVSKLTKEASKSIIKSNSQMNTELNAKLIQFDGFRIEIKTIEEIQTKTLQTVNELQANEKNRDLKMDRVEAEQAKIREDVNEMRVDQAELRAEQVKIREDVNELRADQVRIREDVSEMRTDQAGIKEDVNEMRMNQAELRAEQVKIREDVNELRVGQDELRAGQDELRAGQAKLLSMMNQFISTVNSHQLNTSFPPSSQ
jgi:uncharacterized coiled-coil DUF342 family protein